MSVGGSDCVQGADLSEGDGSGNESEEEPDVGTADGGSEGYAGLGVQGGLVLAGDLADVVAREEEEVGDLIVGHPCVECPHNVPFNLRPWVYVRGHGLLALLGCLLLRRTRRTWLQLSTLTLIEEPLEEEAVLDEAVRRVVGLEGFVEGLADFGVDNEGIDRPFRRGFAVLLADRTEGGGDWL